MNEVVILATSFFFINQLRLDKNNNIFAVIKVKKNSLKNDFLLFSRYLYKHAKHVRL